MSLKFLVLVLIRVFADTGFLFLFFVVPFLGLAGQFFSLE